MGLTRIHDSDLRVAMVSMHTSPLDQPGSGDAGGLNVYVAQTAQRLAEAGAMVDVFTRATSSQQSDVVAMAPGVDVHHLSVGPFEGMRKEDLPGLVCPFTAELMRAALRRPEGYYDLVHSHYWLSGQSGWLAAQRWGVPLVHTMHTLAKVKNHSLAAGDQAEPVVRVVGEEQLVSVSDRLIANTAGERDELVGLYDADPAKIDVVHPGVDLDRFSPGDRDTARARLGLATDRQLVLFVGRIQPLKAPDLLIRAIADLVAREPGRRDSLEVIVCGGLSGNGLARPDELGKLAAELGVADIVGFAPPAAPHVLADYYRSADVVAVPSYSESFGLVALEAQACGTPVLAAGVGGLRTAVADGVSGLLVADHDEVTWSHALARLLSSVRLRSRLARGAVAHSHNFSWSATAGRTLAVYEDAIEQKWSDGARQHGGLRVVN